MTRFNTTTTRPATQSVIRSTGETGTTYEGGTGYARDAKSELFITATTTFLGENTFYESADGRNDRLESLTQAVAADDPQWLVDFVRWLRNEANIRTAALFVAVTGARYRTANDLHGYSRSLIDAAISRADEPGEVLAAWTSLYGRAIPKPVKRGVADALKRVYSEYSMLKYDTASKGFRFGDVIELVHPSPADDKPWQGTLFQHAIERRHNRATEVPEELPMVLANLYLRKDVADGQYSLLLDPERLKTAGFTWEDALSLVGSKVDKRKLWEALIPNMGLMALLRNLRGFDQAEVSDEVASTISRKLIDPDVIAKSRQLPVRFLSAYRAAPSLRWAYPLERALDLSLGNVPSFGGRTLVLVDTSSSMRAALSERSDLARWDAAAVFGLAFAKRAENADVVSYSSSARYYSDPIGTNTKVFTFRQGGSLLNEIQRWDAEGYFLGGGTDTEGAVRQHFAGHDRIVLLTDEQAGPGYGSDVFASVPKSVQTHTVNLAGYRHGHAPSGEQNRHTYSGLSDAHFKTMKWVEQGTSARWPWEG